MNTKALLKEALTKLKDGKSLETVAREMKLEQDDVWGAVRHFGYFTSTGRFIQDRNVDGTPVRSKAA